jgi:hypothetical protein
MRSDMFRRSDYAHGGVVHFERGGMGDTFAEDLFGNSPEALVEDQLRLEAIAKNKKPVVKDPNAGMRILPSAPSGGGGEGGGGGINLNKDIRETLDFLKQQRDKPEPKVQTIEEQEAEREKRGLNALPKTSTSRLEEIQQSYNRPRTWDENLSLMKQDALKARSGAGFSDTDIGGAARSLDASNREKSIAISLKLEEIENLDNKAQFAFKNGNFEAAKKFTQEAEKLRADIMEKRGTIAAHTLTGLGALERAGKVGIGSGLKGATTLSESTIIKAKTNINEFVNSPRLDSEFWDFVPNADVIKEKLKVGKKPGNPNYDSAIQDLQKFKLDIYNGYVSDLRGERAVATKKQVK